MWIDNRKLEIASRVRMSVEDYAKRNGYPESLACLCVIASVALTKAFWLNKINAHLFEGHFKGKKHYWVVSENEVFDITVTQFGDQHYPPVFSVPVEDKRYDGNEIIVNLDDLHNWEDLPYNQKPLKDITNGIVENAMLEMTINE